MRLAPPAFRIAVLLFALVFVACDRPNNTVPDAGTPAETDGGAADGGAMHDGGSLCTPGSTASCYAGPSGTENVGACKAGTKTCDGEGAAYGPCVGELLPALETCATDGDEDCDGQVNEEGAGCSCVPGSTEPCFTGPASAADAGVCRPGTRVCNALGTAWETCLNEVLPSPETCTTDLDDDCDGLVNEEGSGCTCVPGTTASCFTGPSGALDAGVCASGTMTCNALGTAFGACVGEVLPSPETCTTAVDDDCDGQVNEEGMGCTCVPGSTASCFNGPAGTAGVGLCTSGTMTCNALGTGYGACVGEVVPSAETCTTPEDDDCDGQANEEGAGCVCAPNSTTSCFSGAPGTLNVGPCRAGTMTCNAQGTAYGGCVGEVTPVPETCATSLDDDCDGQTNEEGPGCVCTPGSTASCFSGPVGTVNVGICRAGAMTCNSQGTAFGPCVGEITPSPETCATPDDDDCDGQTNESGAGCVCAPNSNQGCYTGPAGTQGVGACRSGTRTCNAQGTAYGSCVGEVLPSTEVCSTPADDDCDGQSNEGCAALTCNLLQESFDDGTADAVTNGVYQASWCDTVIPASTNTPLCMTGRTLRTNDATIDPTLWIYKAQASCISARITYSYYQFASAAVTLRWQQSNDTAPVCENPGLFNNSLVHPTLQACVQQTTTIAFGISSALYVRFEHGTGTNAIWLDNVQVELLGCDC